MPLNKFPRGGNANAKATTTAPAKATATKARKQSRFAGSTPSANRDPMPFEGTYRLKLVQAEEGVNPKNMCSSGKFYFEIVDLDEQGAEHHKVGGRVFITERITGDGAIAGHSRITAMVVALGGFEDFDEYQAFDPDRYFIDAVLGEDNEYSTDGQPLIGRFVDVQVTRGKDTADGSDWYRVYSWDIVPEEEQEVAKPAA